MMHDTETESSLDSEAVKNFKIYLRFPTVHPVPDYYPAVKWLSSVGSELGLECKVIEIVPPNPILLMCWRGSEPSLPALLLNSHMDVVPVDRDKWTYDPFAAVEVGGFIYGRGTQDMKSVGIQQLEAVRRLKSRGFAQLRRTVYLTFVPDEELGGSRGMLPFITQPYPQASDPKCFDDLNVGLCLDEGLASPNEDYIAYFDERRPCWFNALFHGRTGHGLQMAENTSGEKLRKFLDRIMDFREQEKHRLASKDPLLDLGDVTTVNLTMLSGGLQQNILPPTLKASFDVRLTPSLKLERWKKQLEQWADESGGGIEFEFVNTGGDAWSMVPSWDCNPCSLALQRVCDRAGISLKHRVFPGATDARFARHSSAKIPAVGFSPMRRTPQLLHDHDERLSVKEFLEGCRFYADLVFELAQS